MNILRLNEKYNKEVVPAMMKKFGYKNTMAVPKIKKIVVNTCFGREVTGKTSQEREKFQKTILQDLMLITGQKPKLVKSKKSISSFKLREGLEIAATVTLRNRRMYDFLEKIIYLSFPRSRDFKGINPKSIDQRGNITIGLREHISFPEIITEREKTIFGLEITITTNARNKEEGLELYKLIGLPIKS